MCSSDLAVTLTGLTAGSTYSSSMELLSELSYPVSEGVSANAVMLVRAARAKPARARFATWDCNQALILSVARAPLS